MGETKRCQLCAHWGPDEVGNTSRYCVRTATLRLYLEVCFDYKPKGVSGSTVSSGLRQAVEDIGQAGDMEFDRCWRRGVDEATKRVNRRDYREEEVGDRRRLHLRYNED